MRTVTVVITAAVITSLGSLATAQDVQTRYFLPKSVVTLSGTITTKDTFPSVATQGMVAGGSVEVSQLAVTLSSVPDTSMPMLLSSESSLLSKTTAAVELTSSGLLTGVNAKSEGLLGNIVKNVFGAAVSLAHLAGGRLMSEASVAERMYENEHNTEATRRRGLKTAIQKATDLLLAAEQSVAAAMDTAARKPFKERIDDLKASLANLRGELALAETHFTAWKARKENSRERRFERVIDVDDLPADAAVRKLADDGTSITADGLAAISGTFGPVVKQTRLVLTQSTAPPAAVSAVKADDVSASVRYRAVRPITLAVYVLSADNKVVLSKESTEYVTGRGSPLVTLPVFHSKWSTKSLGVTFVNGVLAKLTTETGAELAGAAEALRGLPTEYLASLKQSNEIIGEQNKLAVAGIQGQIDALKKDKELIEARVVSGESADLAAMQAQTARLDAELKLLASQRSLAGSQLSVGDSGALAVQVQVIKLQNELAEAQMKQLQLQQQLDELRRKVGQ